MVPNRNPAARLYAPVEHQHRPQVTPPVEQGKLVVLSHIFSPPARVGVGTWRRCLVLPLLWDGVPSLLPIHSSLFPITSLCGARLPRRAPGAALFVGRAKPRLGPLLSVA